MPEGFERRLRREAGAWVEDGVISSEQADAILDRHPIPRDDGEEGRGLDWAQALLYGTAGILLGAAALALIMVGLEPQDPSPYLLFTGAGLFGLGLVLDRLPQVKDLMASAVLAGSLVPLTVSTFDTELYVAWVIALAAPAGLLVYKRAQPFVPSLSVIAFSVAAPAGAFSLYDTF
ncbi:MAG: hypothetical protein R3185_08120, partial [Candidatus Thermoplasmatota archaeon]|nr:hypothetical protein [Candidatus Thermoplasmatota archaeon]